MSPAELPGMLTVHRIVMQTQTLELAAMFLADGVVHFREQACILDAMRQAQVKELLTYRLFGPRGPTEELVKAGEVPCQSAG